MVSEVGVNTFRGTNGQQLCDTQRSCSDNAAAYVHYRAKLLGRNVTV